MAEGSWIDESDAEIRARIRASSSRPEQALLLSELSRRGQERQTSALIGATHLLALATGTLVFATLLLSLPAMWTYIDAVNHEHPGMGWAVGIGAAILAVVLAFAVLWVFDVFERFSRSASRR